MGVRSAKDAIREARLKAGLTQEQLAEGICTVQALSRIETGTAGVSPATFQALMERAGAPCERYPIFADRNDFDCFYSLRQARFHLDSWQLTPAYEALQRIEDCGWAYNRLYYQEWLLLHCRLQSMSCDCDHDQNYQTLLEALRISRPDIDLSDFQGLLLSQNELQLLSAIAREALSLGRTDLCLQIYTQLESHLSHSKFTDQEKMRLVTENALIYGKYLLALKDYEGALHSADRYRQKPETRRLPSQLLELNFLSGLCCHYLGDSEQAAVRIKAAFYSAHAIDSCYANLCRDYLRDHTDFPMPAYMKELPAVTATAFPAKTAMDTSGLSDGVFNADSGDFYTLGNLIRDLRTEQKLSLQLLSQGLCSRSALSKIENGTLQPGIALTEALLQRLGLTERVFTFWGNEKEAKLYELKYKIMDAQSVLDGHATEYLDEMERLLDKGDVLYRQDYFVASAMELTSPTDQICKFTEALQCTLPDFDIYKLPGYRLSWEELSILNCLADAYRKAERYDMSNLYFFHLSEYQRQVPMDIVLRAQIFPYTIQDYYHTLYVQKQHKMLLNLMDQNDMSVIKYHMLMYGFCLFYYSQSLGECGRYDEAVLPAVYACNLNCLMDLSINSDILRKALFRDFSIVLKD